MTIEPLRLIEPVQIDDDFCTRLGLIEEIGPCVRFVLITQATCYETGLPLSVVKRKIVMPLEGARESREAVRRFLAERAARDGSMLRVV